MEFLIIYGIGMLLSSFVLGLVHYKTLQREDTLSYPPMEFVIIFWPVGIIYIVFSGLYWLGNVFRDIFWD